MKRTLGRPLPSWSPEVDVQRKAAREIIEQLFDFDEIARRTLDGRWDGLTPAQRQDFTGGLRALIERRPVGKASRIARDVTVTYGPEEIEALSATVRTVVALAAPGRTARHVMDFRLVWRHGRWRVADVGFDGEGMVDGYRQEFEAIIRRESFEGLLLRMHQKLSQIPPGEP